PGAGDGEGAARDRKAQREEREQRIERDGVLHLHERHPPDGGDRDQNEKRRHDRGRLRFAAWTRSTPSDGRCATFASRSPTAAISAASTACRRRSTAATTASSTGASCSRSRRSHVSPASSSTRAFASCASRAASPSSAVTWSG